MDEPGLRQLLDQVKRGRVSRRGFVQMMAALGIGAPLAAQMLASAGVAAAQQRAPYLVPTRRGGGGDLRILMWDAPTMLHPHFGRGLRDMTASRLFYEPLAAPAPDGTFAPVLAEEIPSVAAGGLAKDGQWVIWKLKKNVVWHDGAPFTADDVIFNWTFAIDPANVTSTRGAFEEVAKIDKLDSHTVKVVYKKPQPFWASVFTGGGLLPKHIFEPLKGAGSRDSIGMVKPVGTGPYKLVEFKPGDWIRAEINMTYHVPEPAVLRPPRHQVRRRLVERGARRAADRRVRLRLLRPDGGGRPAAHRAGRQQGPHPRRCRRAASASSSATRAIRGPRSTASGRARSRPIRSSPTPRCGPRSRCSWTGRRSRSTSSAAWARARRTS